MTNGDRPGLRRFLELVVAVGVLGVFTVLAAADPAPPAPPGSAGAQPGVTADTAQRHTPTPSRTTSPTPTSAPSKKSAAITFTGTPDPNPAALAAFYGQRLKWSTCKGGQCATVRVPVVYAEPGGKTIEIALLKAPARKPAKRKGTLFVNPGGPGGSGIDFVRNGGDYFGSGLRDVWDIVGFDPRGMGKSAGFDCLTARDLDALYAADPTPDTAAERRALEEAGKRRVEGCVRRGGTLALNMGTENVVRDLDILRDAVGDERLNYLGVSYGTLIGSMYADAFTSRVGLMVLDSAVPPDALDEAGVTQADVDAMARATGRDLAETMKQFAKACIADGCPLGDSPKQVSAAVVALLDRLDQHPLPTDIKTLPRLTEGWAADAIRFGLSTPDAWPDLADAIATARDDGDGTWLADMAMFDVGREADGTYPGASFGKNHLPVSCADWPRTTADSMSPSATVFEEYPIYAHLLPPAVDDCAYWPGPLRSNLLVGAEPATQILVIGNKRDPVTPIQATHYLASMLVRSRFVTVDADGHGAYGNGNACADRVVTDYLVKSVPPPNAKACPAG